MFFGSLKDSVLLVCMYMLFASLGSVRLVKNCDQGLENAAAAAGSIFKTEVQFFEHAQSNRFVFSANQICQT